MKKRTYNYLGEFAGHNIHMTFRHPDTALYFHSYVKPDLNQNCERLTIPKSDYSEWMNSYGMKDDGNTEFGLAVFRISDLLSQYRICVIHGAAFLWNEKAYLFCAKSGTGKSTQIRRWMELYYDEIQMINGDKPLLIADGWNPVTVCSSPWKGKEEWGEDSISAPLGGIVLLEQAEFNRISLCNTHQSAYRILSNIFGRFESEESIHNMCVITGEIIEQIPIWKLENKGDTESAVITYEALKSLEKNK